MHSIFPNAKRISSLANRRFIATDAQRLKDIKTIGVIGAGQMGVGISYVAATSGRNVVLLDSNEMQIKKGLEFVGNAHLFRD